MQRTLVATGLAALALAIGALGGFALGQRQGLEQGLRLLETEVYGGLAIRVETASRVRVGDIDGALELLDVAIDTTVLNSGGVLEGPFPQKRNLALAQAKLYRSVVPATGQHATEISRVLETVPSPNGSLFVCIRSDGKPVQASGLSQLTKRE